MRKKQEAYIPQFDLDDNMVVSKKVCKCCGNLVNEKNVTADGFCIECVMNNKAPIVNKFAHPDKYTYESFCHFLKESRKKKNNTLRAVAAAILPTAAMMNTSEFDDEISKIGSFNENNRKTVYIRDELWVCPCCLQDNSGPHYCKRCGVYPKFKLMD